jgi:hypothetical protein
VQSDRCAPYPDSVAAQQPIGARAVSTICDGIAVKRPGELTLPLVSEYVDEIVTVSDDDVAQAMVLLLERSKLVVEGAGAASVAALLAGKIEPPADGDVCALLSGGNVDAARLVECIRLGETASGRRLVFSTVVPDRPGALARLVGTVAEQRANVLDVVHLREGVDLHVRDRDRACPADRRARSAGDPRGRPRRGSSTAPSVLVAPRQRRASGFAAGALQFLADDQLRTLRRDQRPRGRGRFWTGTSGPRCPGRASPRRAAGDAGADHHQRLVSDELGRLVDEAVAETDGLPYESDEVAWWVTRRREKARRVPAELQAEITRTSSVAEHAG